MEVNTLAPSGENARYSTSLKKCPSCEATMPYLLACLLGPEQSCRLPRMVLMAQNGQKCPSMTPMTNFHWSSPIDSHAFMLNRLSPTAFHTPRTLLIDAARHCSMQPSASVRNSIHHRRSQTPRYSTPPLASIASCECPNSSLSRDCEGGDGGGRGSRKRCRDCND